MLSFLMPAYNSDDTVAEAVEAVLAVQVDVEFELVAVDDGSTDETLRVLERIAERDPRLRVLRHDSNLGGGQARNTAATAARGDLLYITDADNVLPPGTVQPQLDVLRESGAGAVSVAVVQYFDGANGRRLHRWRLRHKAGWSTIRHAFETNAVPASHGNYLFTRAVYDAAGGYETALGAMESFSFGLKHLARGADVAIAPGTHYLHRLNRPGRPSYWTREEHLGRNNENALTSVLRERDLLPDDLREKVGVLRAGDPFHALVAAGAFRRRVGTARFDRKLARLR